MFPVRGRTGRQKGVEKKEIRRRTRTETAEEAGNQMPVRHMSHDCKRRTTHVSHLLSPHDSRLGNKRGGRHLKRIKNLLSQRHGREKKKKSVKLRGKGIKNRVRGSGNTKMGKRGSVCGCVCVCVC